jgi:rubrerythrin
MFRWLLLTLVVLGSHAAGAVTPQQLSDSVDLTVLGYALTLEHLESAFYNGGLAIYNTSANYTSAGYDASVFGFLQMVQAHEAAHVVYLTNAMNAASANSAPPACTYNFTSAYSSVTSFLATAQALENGGQSAYDGALNGITNPAYAQVAAQIATVEARHAAYLNELNGTSPFPMAFDTANTPTTILAVVTPFLVPNSCPYTLTLPTIRPTGVALDNSNNVVATGTLTASYTAAQQANDIAVLNYALTLEHFEAAFYNYVNATFNNASFAAANVSSYYYTYTQAITAHENIHVATLTSVINGRVPGAAVPACNYTFASITTIAQYLATAQILENTGVMAYDGAAGLLTDTGLQQVAATIATVEARHAAFLNQANGASPFPNIQDSGATPQNTITSVQATHLLTSCPYTIQFPSYITPGALTTSSTGPNGAALSASVPSWALLLVFGYLVSLLAL